MKITTYYYDYNLQSCVCDYSTGSEGDTRLKSDDAKSKVR